MQHKGAADLGKNTSLDGIAVRVLAIYFHYSKLALS